MNMVARAIVAGAVLTAAGPAAAQTVQRPPQATAAQMQARQQIASFEVALEKAVRYGAQMLDQRLQASSAANMVMLAGMPRARGFRLDDYGVMFDVEFPSMRKSMVWSMQELERANLGGAMRAAQPGTAIQPREIYQNEITDALLNVILDYTGAIGLAPAEWLTVAARESVVDRRFVDAGVNEAPMTVILRMKGGDLHALREGKLAREEARKRVDVKHY
ncbi:MAG: hypothetical protein EHM55_21980 [Acidobacteria bacterium]|nr:MAG: hypothetical protein EHM55_21980 [Acidobacteriota bacterium]